MAQRRNNLQTRLTSILAMFMLLAGVHSALAVMGPRYIITPDTQLKQQLEFTLTTTPERDDTLIVRIDIPKQGKLKDLGGMQMELSDDRSTLLLSPLATTTHDGAVTASFQIARYLVNVCYINLFVVVDPRYSICYSVSLKSYMPDKA